MPDQTLDDPRITENLKGLTKVRIRVLVIEESKDRCLEETRLRTHVENELKERGLIPVTDDSAPEFVLAIKVREHLSREGRLFLIRLESFLREQVSLLRVETNPVPADVWRHRAVFDVQLAAVVGSALQRVIEVATDRQLCAFLDDWARHNPDRATTTSGEHEILKAISGIGPVFEQRLKDSGVCTLRDLAELSDDEISLLADRFTIRGPDNNVVGDPGTERLGQFREKARSMLGL